MNLIPLKLWFLVTLMVHPWLKLKMRFVFRRQDLEIICALLFNVPTVKSKIFVAETWYQEKWKMKHLMLCANE